MYNNLDYGSFRTVKDLSEKLGSMDLDTEAQIGFKNRYLEYQKDIQQSLSDTLDGIFGADRKQHTTSGEIEKYLASEKWEKFFDDYVNEEYGNGELIGDSLLYYPSNNKNESFVIPQNVKRVTTTDIKI